MMTPFIEYITIIALGLIIGSFINVCIYRLPREKNILFPPSACTACGKKIRFYDNIPIISYLLLAGKCRDCKGHISIKYPLVELLNALFYMAAYLRFGFDYSLLFICPFLSALIVITFIDLDFQIIPDSITLPGILLGLIASSFIFPDPFEYYQITGFMNALIGFITGGGLFFLIALLSRGGMGGGDIKMMAMVGTFLGWKGVLLTTLIGSVAGSLVGIALMVFKGKDRKAKIPFGPFLALGALISLFAGRIILQLYLNGDLMP